MRRPQLLTTVPLPGLSTQHQVPPRTSEACFCVRVSESLQTPHTSHRETISWKLSWTYILRSLCVFMCPHPAGRKAEAHQVTGVEPVVLRVHGSEKTTGQSLNKHQATEDRTETPPGAART